MWKNREIFIQEGRSTWPIDIRNGGLTISGQNPSSYKSTPCSISSLFCLLFAWFLPEDSSSGILTYVFCKFSYGVISVQIFESCFPLLNSVFKLIGNSEWLFIVRIWVQSLQFHKSLSLISDLCFFSDPSSLFLPGIKL